VFVSGSFEVSHSFIDHSGSFSTSTTLSLKNNSLINMITYQLQFFNSLHCNAEMPLIDRTPIKTMEKSEMRSYEETLRMTYERTIDQTIRETQINILNGSPMNTLKQTPINTIDQTIRETPKETIPRTYAESICTNQRDNKREISVIIAFLYPLIIPNLF